jgi:hypothetical protein
VLLPQPGGHVELWRKQLGLIAQQGGDTKRALEAAAAETSTSRGARVRLHALAQAVADQVDEITAILGPVLGGALPAGDVPGLPRGVVEYIAYLYRDWGWPNDQCDENERSLDAIRRVMGTHTLGRTLVLGAGACRLAYDLHRNCRATGTAVLDIDPYLLVMAAAVVRGAAVHLTESAANVQEGDAVSRRWTLSAPADPLGEGVFHFYLANGIEPPFEDQTFDTVVTPWFIDQVPTDLRAFLVTVHRLLVPGGKWINHGPLVYRPDTIPISRWYPREELYDVARAAGFRIDQWESESRAYLVSPLTGRGKVEKTLTFLALQA